MLAVENAKKQNDEVAKLEEAIAEKQRERDALRDKAKDLQNQIDEVEKQLQDLLGKNQELMEQNETLQLLVSYERELRQVVSELEQLEDKIFAYGLRND